MPLNYIFCYRDIARVAQCIDCTRILVIDQSDVIRADQFKAGLLDCLNYGLTFIEEGTDEERKHL